MVNPEEVLQSLGEFSKLKPKDIPRELEEYLMYVAKTGDPVYQWSLVKCLFREKMLNVITDFYESCPSIDMPPCPNVDSFNYETMKSSLLERLESFPNAPFTVQRICELLTTPRKEYTRVDKFMRAIEKNILVVSTKEPGGRRNRSDAASQSQQSEVLMNGVMEARGPGGLDIGEAIETVSAEGVNLMQVSDAAVEGPEVSLAESIRVECEDIEMDDGTTATTVVWDTKVAECSVSADSLKGLSSPTDSTSTSSGASVVWDGKVEECRTNSDGLKVVEAAPETSTIVWDTKDADTGEGLKNLSSTSDGTLAAGDSVAISKPNDDEQDATAVAVVSEFLSATPGEVFGQSLNSGMDSVPLVLSTPELEHPLQVQNTKCNIETTTPQLPLVVDEVNLRDEPETPEQLETENKEISEHKDSESEEISQVDAESGVGCSTNNSSVSSDCATAEMHQTLETDGSLEIASVESEVMSPLGGLEDVTANISSPDSGSNHDAGGNTPPPTFAEMTADEDTQDAPRSVEAPDDETDVSQCATQLEDGSKPESVVEPCALLETKMDVDEPETMNILTDETDATRCSEVEVPAEIAENESQTSSQNETTADTAETSEMPYDIV